MDEKIEESEKSEEIEKSEEENIRNEAGICPDISQIMRIFSDAVKSVLSIIVEAYYVNARFFGENTGTDPAENKTISQLAGLYTLSLLGGIFYLPWRILKDSSLSMAYQAGSGINEVFIPPTDNASAPSKRFDVTDSRSTLARFVGFPGFLMGFTFRLGLYALAVLGISRYAYLRLRCTLIEMKDLFLGAEDDSYQTDPNYNWYEDQANPKNESISLFLSYVNVARLFNLVIYGLGGLLAFTVGSRQSWVKLRDWLTNSESSDSESSDKKPKNLKFFTQVALLPSLCAIFAFSIKIFLHVPELLLWGIVGSKATWQSLFKTPRYVVQQIFETSTEYQHSLFSVGVDSPPDVQTVHETAGFFGVVPRLLQMSILLIGVAIGAIFTVSAWHQMRRAVFKSNRFLFGDESLFTEKPSELAISIRDFSSLPWLMGSGVIITSFLVKFLNLATRFFLVSGDSLSDLYEALKSCGGLLVGQEDLVNEEYELLTEVETKKETSEMDRKHTIRDAVSKVALLSRGLQGLAYLLTGVIAATLGSRQSWCQAGRGIDQFTKLLFGRSFSNKEEILLNDSTSATVLSDEQNWHKARFWSRFAILPWLLGGLVGLVIGTLRLIDIVLRTVVGAPYAWKRLGYDLLRYGKVLLGDDAGNYADGEREHKSLLKSTNTEEKDKVARFFNRAGILPGALQFLGGGLACLWAGCMGVPYAWRELARGLNTAMYWIMGSKTRLKLPVRDLSDDKSPPSWAMGGLIPISMIAITWSFAFILNFLGFNAANYYRLKDLFTHQNKGIIAELEAEEGIGGFFAKYNVMRAAGHLLFYGLVTPIFLSSFLIQMLWKLTFGNIFGNVCGCDGYFSRIYRQFIQPEPSDESAKIKYQLANLLHALSASGYLNKETKLENMVEAWKNKGFFKRLVDGFVYDVRKAAHFGKNTPVEQVIIDFAEAYDRSLLSHNPKFLPAHEAEKVASQIISTPSLVPGDSYLPVISQVNLVKNHMMGFFSEANSSYQEDDESEHESDYYTTYKL